MTAVLFKFSYPDGTPVADAPFLVTTRKPSFDETLHNGIQVPGDVVGTTDAQGEATLTLVAGFATYYLLMDPEGTAQSGDGCGAGFRYRFMVPTSSVPVRVEDLIVTAPTWSRPWDETALQIIIEAKAISQASAVAAAESAADAEEALAQMGDNAERAEAAANAADLSKTAAAGFASTASTKAGESAASASAALASKNTAAASATSATQAKDAAALSATSASTSATSATNSAASASNSAITAVNNATVTNTNAAATAADKVATGADRAAVAADKITVTDLKNETKVYRDEAQAAVGSIVGVISDGGAINMSGGAYPAKPAVSTVWRVTVAGVVVSDGNTDYNVGDQLFYTKAGDYFYKVDSTDAVTSVAGRKGAVVVTQTDVGLPLVNNTSDAAKPISTATQAALDVLTAKNNATLKVAFIGDSLSQASVRNNEWGQQTCSLIQKLTGTPVQFRNLAINGASFNTALNVKEHMNATKSQVEACVEFVPDLVFIALGANDAVYSSLITQAQMIANAQAVFDALRSGIPGVKIIYAEEQLHDLTAGVTPSALNNQDAVPVSHTTITLNGLSNVRVNTSAYLNTALSAPKLAAHQLWGNATTAIRAMADGWFSANIWKMARMGCMLDYYHVDQMGHTYWAWQAITYLSTTSIAIPKVNFGRLKIQNLTANLTTNLDTAYTEALAKTPEGTAGAEYYGNSVYQRMTNWMLRARYGRMSCESAIGSAVHDLSYTVEKVWPGAQIHYSAGTSGFVNSARAVGQDGTHTQTLYPGSNSFLTTLLVAGTYPFYVAAVNPDGSADVFVQNLVVVNNFMPVGATALRYLSADVTLPVNTTLYLPFSASERDDIGMGAVGSAFTIPASLNGRKVRFRANVRVVAPLTSADVTNCFVNCNIQKNRTPAPGNSNAAGRGLPAQNVLLTSAGTVAVGADVSMASAAVTVATGDYFEVVVSLVKTSTADGTIRAHSVTWFEIEVVS